jgi:hypothetical protein
VRFRPPVKSTPDLFETKADRLKLLASRNHPKYWDTKSTPIDDPETYALLRGFPPPRTSRHPCRCPSVGLGSQVCRTAKKSWNAACLNRQNCLNSVLLLLLPQLGDCGDFCGDPTVISVHMATSQSISPQQAKLLNQKALQGFLSSSQRVSKFGKNGFLNRGSPV